MTRHIEFPNSRRDFLARAGAGFGLLALQGILSREARGQSPPENTTAATAAHALSDVLNASVKFPRRVERVIWCFIDGGPSHIDLFDPKPELNRLAGKPLPDSVPKPLTAMGRTAFTPILPSKRSFARYGDAGTWVSDWYPNIARHVDEIALLRGCHADGLNHVGSVCQMNTGSILAGRPSLGAWCHYGLGIQTDELPAFVVLCDYPEDPPGGSRNWSTGFMPATYQGTKFRAGARPILHLSSHDSTGDVAVDDLRRRNALDFVQQLNRMHLRGRQDEDQLEARIASYELAFRMQAAAPEAVNLGEETEETLRLYGVTQPATERNGRNCLLARRLIERGVRFVQLYFGSGSKWDAHKDVEGNHSKNCRESDLPIAGLLEDLRRRGLLESTLVIWGGEFGRTPMSESGDGRDHNPYGFSMWMAGGGIRGGVTHGATDDLGLHAVSGKTHVHDLHATILRLLGIEHTELTYLHNGRNERLTVNAGNVIEEILA